jgi:hypothetical protein
MSFYLLIRNDDEGYCATRGESGSMKSSNSLNLFKCTSRNNILMMRSIFQNVGSVTLNGFYAAQC